MMTTLTIACSVLAIAAFVFHLAYQVTEGKDERGQHLLKQAMSISFPLLILGWVALEIVDRFADLTFDEYRLGVLFMVFGTYIVQSVILLYLHFKKS